MKILVFRGYSFDWTPVMIRSKECPKPTYVVVASYINDAQFIQEYRKINIIDPDIQLKFMPINFNFPS